MAYKESVISKMFGVFGWQFFVELPASCRYCLSLDLKRSCAGDYLS